jgi:2-polyprenyl-6-methoxyphenol hydroxylase-like FAD-dependent oxidoreductase
MGGRHPDERFDVVVVGGGSAGVGAAIGAADVGASTCLIERYPFLGGAATASSLLCYCGFFDQRREQVVGGVGEQLLERLRAGRAYEEKTFRWSGNTVVMIDPEFTKFALDAMVARPGITVLLHSYLIAARTDNDQVTEVVVADHGGMRTISGRQFVDTTGEGNLASLAGAAIRVPAPDDRQVATLSMRIGGVPEGAVISSDAMRAAVAIHNASRERQLSRDHGPIGRLPLTGELTMQIVDQAVDALDGRDLTRAETNARGLAWDYLEAFREHIDGWQDAYLVSTGPQLGIRESRHLVGRDTVTRDDVLSARREPDRGIARCGWPIEEHHTIGTTSYTPIEGRSFYDIPLDALHSVSHQNLWAGGRLVSSDADAYCSLRVMGTSFATGQAAGVAAALHVAVERPAPSEVRRELRRQKALV